jgi:hypothetical protein
MLDLAHATARAAAVGAAVRLSHLLPPMPPPATLPVTHVRDPSLTLGHPPCSHGRVWSTKLAQAGGAGHRGLTRVLAKAQAARHRRPRPPRPESRGFPAALYTTGRQRDHLVASRDTGREARGDDVRSAHTRSSASRLRPPSPSTYDARSRDRPLEVRPLCPPPGYPEGYPGGFHRPLARGLPQPPTRRART